MTFVCNMFILAGLAGAAGVLPVPGAIVSPAFIPHSCSHIAEGTVRPRWDSGAGEATRVSERKPKKRVPERKREKRAPERGNTWIVIPWDAPRPALGSGGTLQQSPCRLRPGGVEGVLMAEHKMFPSSVFAVNS